MTRRRMLLVIPFAFALLPLGAAPGWAGPTDLPPPGGAMTVEARFGGSYGNCSAVLTGFVPDIGTGTILATYLLRASTTPYYSASGASIRCSIPGASTFGGSSVAGPAGRAVAVGESLVTVPVGQTRISVCVEFSIIYLNLFSQPTTDGGSGCS